MFKTESVTGRFVDPNETTSTRIKEPLCQNVFNLTAILPEIKNYKERLSQTEQANVYPYTFNNNQHQPTRSTSCMRLRTSKNKSKRRKTSVFMQLSTINRPNILHSYLSYNEILQYLDYIKVRFTNFTCIHTLGVTFERRPIKCIEINWNSVHNIWSKAQRNHTQSASFPNMELKNIEDKNMKKNDRNIIFIEGGTHAREWISISVALNCIYQLTEKNSRHRDLLRNLIFYIVPVVNPDGYEYARNVNPRWRKNRRPHISGDNVGIDCNRNYDFHWNQCRSKAKRNTYQGDKPFSEQETTAIAKILHSLAPKLLFYLSLHSYAQTIMYPWGYTNIQPKNAKLMESVAIAGRIAIKSLSGRYYRVGGIAHITKRNIAGSVIDYAHGVVNIPLTLVMELPSREYGFQPPADKIYPLGMESWHGIRAMCRKAYSLKNKIEELEKEAAEQLHDQTMSTKTETTLTEKGSVMNAVKTEKSRKTNKFIQNKNFKSRNLQLFEGIITSMLDVKF